jgi:hypothetical protein
MNTKETAADPHASHANGGARIHWSAIAHRVKHGVSELPANLGDRMKHDPFAALGIAAVAGIGVGIVLGSRILRTALTSAVTYAVVELARTYLLERMPTVDVAHVPHVAGGPRAPHS